MNRVLAFIGAVGTLLAIISTTLLLKDRANRPEISLVASVTYGSIVVSPDRQKESEIVEQLRHPGLWLDNSVKLPYELLSRVETALQKLVPQTLSHPRGYIHVTINNDGTQAATDVRLTIPQATILVVKSEGKSDQEIVGPILMIGTLPATESVDVTAFMDSAVSWLDVDKIRLTHTSGVGRKVFMPERPPEEPGLWWMPMVWVIGIGVAGLVAMAMFAAWRELLLDQGRREGAEAAKKAATTVTAKGPNGDSDFRPS